MYLLSKVYIHQIPLQSIQDELVVEDWYIVVEEKMIAGVGKIVVDSWVEGIDLWAAQMLE